MYLRIGRSESNGETSPKSDLNGAPNLCNAVGELSSVISNLTCWEMSSRFKSVRHIRSQICDPKVPGFQRGGFAYNALVCQ
jgi:hypothetical protein